MGFMTRGGWVAHGRGQLARVAVSATRGVEERRLLM